MIYEKGSPYSSEIQKDLILILFKKMLMLMIYDLLCQEK